MNGHSVDNRMMIDESGSAYFIKPKPPSIDKPSPVNVCIDIHVQIYVCIVICHIYMHVCMYGYTCTCMYIVYMCVLF